MENKERKKGSGGPGRPAVDGKKRQYVIPEDVHKWIMSHGGSRYIIDTMRTIQAITPQS